MKKELIGKIQLIFGIIILLIVIIGLIKSIGAHNQTKELFLSFDRQKFIEQNSQFSEGEATILYYQLYPLATTNAQYFIYSLWGILALAAFISLLFITQGLVNISEQ